MKRGGPKGWPDGVPDDTPNGNRGNRPTVRKWNGQLGKYRDVTLVRTKTDGPGTVVETTAETPKNNG